MTRAGLTELRKGFSGRLLHPGDDDYEAARRIWNGAVDRRPALIARCTGPEDVVSAVRFARSERLLVAVRGGGHNVAGTAVCDGGLMIDLSPMKRIEVDPTRRTARVQPGVLWGELDGVTQPFGLATPGGIVTHTGVAGLALGGGIGWLMRQHGLTCDNLLSADVVTADGRVLRASPTENADLFWGIRGGGGNFGIVTNFEFALHPVGPTVLAGPVLHPAENAVEVLRFYREFASAAPDGLTTIVTLRRAPPLSMLPERVHGKPIVSIGVCYAGAIEDGARMVAPLRAFGSPLADLIQPMAYTTLQGLFDPTVPHGLLYYWKSHFLAGLSDRAVDALVSHAWRDDSPMSYAILFQLGGRVSRIGEDETAYSTRGAPYALNINAVWSDPREADSHIRWTREYWEATRPFARGVYVNFLGDEGEDRVRAAYGPGKYERLVALKNAYDPGNFFRMNQNIAPTI